MINYNYAVDVQGLAATTETTEKGTMSNVQVDNHNMYSGVHAYLIGRLMADAEVIESHEKSIVSMKVAVDETLDNVESVTYYTVSYEHSHFPDLLQNLKKDNIVNVGGYFFSQLEKDNEMHITIKRYIDAFYIEILDL